MDTLDTESSNTDVDNEARNPDDDADKNSESNSDDDMPSRIRAEESDDEVYILIDDTDNVAGNLAEIEETRSLNRDAEVTAAEESTSHDVEAAGDGEPVEVKETPDVSPTISEGNAKKKKSRASKKSTATEEVITRSGRLVKKKVP